MKEGEAITTLSATFSPRLDILPPAQRRLWPELSKTPEEFTLYGGTAIALRLGHRASVDFDFFSTKPFAPNTLMQSVPYLQGGRVLRSEPNTLVMLLDQGGPVQVSFFGGLPINEVLPAEAVEGPGFKVASLLDLAATKVVVVTHRAEWRDYVDVYTLLTKGNIPLAEMLAAAAIVYGSEFTPLPSLKALAYHDDVPELAPEARKALIQAVQKTDPQKLPELQAVKQRSEKA